ncbi:diaminopimelate epimerase [Ruthenibacterium sp. CLA-JM-H11]|uniref:Diaminopimelate epimerase n=1 Tax=Ruthenibacterium intestinale TaxID=3133163 RepID=A0ABV1GF52_9FIRM
MKLKFTKMQGCKNDYLYVRPSAPLPNPELAAVRLSDRHTGVGADGLILLEDSGKADVKMRIFNADGSEGRMCGNGVRCAAEYLFLNGLVEGNIARVETLAGVRTVERLAPGLLRVEMGQPDFSPAAVFLRGRTRPVVEELIEVNGGAVRATCLSMGNPHCVVFVPDVFRAELDRMGPGFARCGLFGQGVNAEFVQQTGPLSLRMRVWERGSGETMACGSGACAAVAAAVRTGRVPMGQEVRVELPGGALSVCWTQEGMTLTGDAARVFTGEIEL